MTKLVCDVHKILDEEAVEGVIRISAETAQYAGTSLMVPEFSEEELVNGQATFDNVEPGRSIIQIHWGFNHQVTIRVSVPDAESVLLSTLALQDLDFEPVIVGEVTKQANSAAESMESALDYLEQAEKEADRAKNKADDSASSASAAAGSESGAKAAQTAAASSKTAAATSASEAAASAAQADSSESEAASSASAASASQSAAKTSETNAASSASKAKTSETNAKASENKAKASETDASSSATAAAASAEAAAGSESGAAGSASAAASSASQADTANTQAGSSRDQAKASARQSGDYRDGAKEHREAAKISESNAAASATSANSSANAASTDASEVKSKLQQALDAITSAEGIEGDLRALMADTEAWQNVIYALEQVDQDIATAMELVKEEILGGVGPAFDTLLELAEALGDNADAIGTLTNELAKKADKGHTHSGADITDAGYSGGEVPNRVMRTSGTGRLYYDRLATSSNEFTNKEYVDTEVARKSNTGHTHTVSQVSGLQSSLDGKAPESHIHAIADVDGLDAALAARSADGHKHDQSDITGTTWTIGHENSGGRVVKTNGDGWLYTYYDPISDNHLVRKSYVDDKVVEVQDIPSADADLNDYRNTGTYIQRANSRAKSGINYPTDYAGTLRVVDDAGAFTYQEYTTYLGGHRYYRDRYNSNWSAWQTLSKEGHTHTVSEITDYPGHTAVMGTNSYGKIPLKEADSDNIRVQSAPEKYYHLTNRSYVDREVGKKADTGHKHSWSQITSKPSTFKPSSHTHGAHEIRFDGNTTGSNQYKISPSNTGNKVVVTGDDGQIWMQTAGITDSHHVVNRAYVNGEVAKKADTGHKHTSSDINDTVYRAGTSSTARKVIRASGTGRLYYGRTPAATDELANKEYVDSRSPQTEIVTSFPSNPDPNTVYYVV